MTPISAELRLILAVRHAGLPASLRETGFFPMNDDDAVHTV